MNSIEEQLWDYIDGNCTESEQAAISALIVSDPLYRRKYDDLLALNIEMAGMDLEQPSMGFTYKVMEVVKAEAAGAPLRSAINKNVIRALVAIFAVIIISLIVYAFFSINWVTGNNGQLSNFKVPEVKMPALGKPVTNFIMQAFMFSTAIGLLFFGDAYLRKQRSAKEL